ncbi:MAG: type II secretion system F family protein [Ectothiorhodospiraceae bacterium]|nr:type II secretion system F family protein [Ectothiorhodospiraceae bacterium]
MAKKATVDTYVWEGMNKQGKRSKGEIAGSTIALVKADLRRQGVTPLKVKKKPKSLFGAPKKKITAQDISIFSRQLATMMSAGVPLVQAFEIVGKGHENPSMQDLIMDVKTTVEGGSTLAEALAKHPYYFDDLYCALVHAGEQAGILETLLDKIATYKEKVEAIKGKIKKALYYPAAILLVSFIITAILLIFVIPQFESMFTSFGGDLPALTKMVVELSNIFQEYWWAIFGALGGAIYGIAQLKRRSKKFNVIMDKVILKLPIIGDIITKAIIARFARTLATMFAAGMPLVEAMDTVAHAAGNAVYTKAILGMKDEVATGQQINVCMKETGLFPNILLKSILYSLFLCENVLFRVSLFEACLLLFLLLNNQLKVAIFFQYQSLQTLYMLVLFLTLHSNISSQ